MDNPVLYIVRHGRTSYNTKGLFRGKVDIPLTQEGIHDAEKASEYLGDISPAFIAASTKKRAVQTAEIFSKKYHIPVVTTDSICAWDLGNFSGKPKNEENLKELETYISSPDTVVPGGESLNEFRERVLPVLAECFAHAAQNGPGIVVVHSSVIHELGNQLFDDHGALVVKPGGIVEVGFEDGKIHAERVFKPLRNHEGAASVS